MFVEMKAARMHKSVFDCLSLITYNKIQMRYIEIYIYYMGYKMEYYDY